MKTSRRVALATLGALAGWPLAQWLTAPGEPEREPRDLRGQAAPEFELDALDPTALRVRPAQFAGRPWLLNAWASWCAPCRDEHGMLVALARDEGVAIVGLNVRDDSRAADEWLRRLGNPYRAVAVDRDGAVGERWGLAGVPATFIVDASLRVRAQVAGRLTREEWTEELAPLWRRLQSPAG